MSKLSDELMRMMKTNPSFPLDSEKARERGITLIELMIAMALSGLIGVLIYQTLFSTLRFYHHGTDDALIQGEVRGILSSIRKDLASASEVTVYPGDPVKPGEITGRSEPSTNSLTKEMKILLDDRAVISKLDLKKEDREDTRIVKYSLNPTNSRLYELLRFQGKNKRVLSSRVENLKVLLIPAGIDKKGKNSTGLETRKGIKFFIQLSGEDGLRKQSYETTLLYD